MSEPMFTRAEIMAIVYRVFDEMRNGATLPTLGAVAARLDTVLAALSVTCSVCGRAREDGSTLCTECLDQTWDLPGSATPVTKAQAASTRRSEAP